MQMFGHSLEPTASFWTAWPWSWRKYGPSKGGVYLSVNTSPVLEDVYLHQHRCTLSLVRAVTWLMLFVDIALSWFCRPERVPRLCVFVCACGRDSRTQALPTYASRPVWCKSVTWTRWTACPSVCGTSLSFSEIMEQNLIQFGNFCL